jgi:hypothetical protein
MRDLAANFFEDSLRVLSRSRAFEEAQQAQEDLKI